MAKQTTTSVTPGGRAYPTTTEALQKAATRAASYSEAAGIKASWSMTPEGLKFEFENSIAIGYSITAWEVISFAVNVDTVLMRAEAKAIAAAAPPTGD